MTQDHTHLPLCRKRNEIFVQEESEEEIVNVLGLLWPPKIEHHDTSLGPYTVSKGLKIHITMVTIITTVYECHYPLAGGSHG